MWAPAKYGFASCKPRPSPTGYYSIIKRHDQFGLASQTQMLLNAQLTFEPSNLPVTIIGQAKRCFYSDSSSLWFIPLMRVRSSPKSFGTWDAAHLMYYRNIIPSSTAQTFDFQFHSKKQIDLTTNPAGFSKTLLGLISFDLTITVKAWLSWHIKSF